MPLNHEVLLLDWEVLLGLVFELLRSLSHRISVRREDNLVSVTRMRRSVGRLVLQVHLGADCGGRVQLEASRIFLRANLDLEVLLDSVLVRDHANELGDLGVRVCRGRERKQATRVHEVVLPSACGITDSGEHAVDCHAAVLYLAAAA